MNQTIVFYYSQHHNNTERLVKGICEAYADAKPVSLTNTDLSNMDLTPYHNVVFASGVYMGKPHDSVLELILSKKSGLLNKRIFTVLTSGSNQKSYTDWFSSYIKENGLQYCGGFQCKGWDTCGAWRYIGGISKKHPNEKDMSEAKVFLKKMTDR